MGLSILATLDHILINWSLEIYALAGDVYDFMLDLADQKYMLDETIEKFTDNIMVFVGVIMLFRLAVALIEYLADPDKMDDKQAGSSKLIVNILMTAAMLVLVNPAFKLLRNLQTALLEDQIIEQVFSGNTLDEEAKGEIVNNGFNCSYSSMKNYDDQDLKLNATFISNHSGFKIRRLTERNVWHFNSAPLNDWTFESISFTTLDGKKAYPGVLLAFYYVPSDSGNDTINTTGVYGCPKYALQWNDYLLFTDDISNLAETYVFKYNNTTDFGTLLPNGELPTSYENTPGRNFAGLLFFNYISCDGTVNNGATTCEKYETYRKKNNFESMSNLLDTNLFSKGSNGEHDADAIQGNGILTMVFGIVMLLFLITSCLDIAVRSLKLTVLQLLSPIPILSYATPKTKSIFDAWIKTIGSVYLDLFIRILVLSLVSFIATSVFRQLQSIGNTFLVVTMILGLLLFIKEAPQFICNMLGIKDTGSLKGFTLNPFQKLREVPIVGGAMGAVGGAVSGAISGAQTGGFAGALMGAAAGGRAGFSNAGGLMGMDAGKKPQAGSGAVGTKVGREFMQGKGGFVSRTIGASAARNYVGNERFAQDEDEARRCAQDTSRTMSRNQAILDIERANLGVSEADVRRSQMAVDAAKARYEADPNDSINMSRLTSAETALADSVSAYERTAIAYQTAQNNFNTSRSADERAQAALAEAERVRKRAQSVVEDAPRTAHDVRYRRRP